MRAEPIPYKEWELFMKFRVSGARYLGGDGFVVWFTAEVCPASLSSLEENSFPVCAVLLVPTRNFHSCEVGWNVVEWKGYYATVRRLQACNPRTVCRPVTTRRVGRQPRTRCVVFYRHTV